MIFGIGHWGADMSERFVAQSLVESKTSNDQRRLELTFVDAGGAKRTLSLPCNVAADLVPVLTSLAGGASDKGGPAFTRLPKHCQVGRARHERLVLIKFDDDPPYALDLQEAESLGRELRAEAKSVSCLAEPLLQ
jgi:hypothetical protein